MIRIRSKTDKFRRCGIAHSQDPVEYPDDHFSEEELEILEAEPELIVTHHHDKEDKTLGEELEERMDNLVAKVGNLDPDNPDLWTKGKKPKAEALGDDVTARERDAVWQKHLEQQDNDTSADDAAAGSTGSEAGE